jgi:type VI secretion system protein ImpK
MSATVRIEPHIGRHIAEPPATLAPHDRTQRLAPVVSLPLAMPMQVGMQLQYGALLRELMDFHHLLTQCRTGAEARANVAAPDAADDAARHILDQLEQAIARQWDNARYRLSDRERSQLRSVQYLMCALADDVFLYDVKWQGRAHWAADVLEERVFGTRVAGERVFEDIRGLIERRDPADAALAAVTLAAIGLGLRGRMRGPAHAAELAAQARALFELVVGRAADPTLGQRMMAPSAIANVVQGHRALHRPVFTLGGFALLAILGWFVAISTFLWFDLTSELAAAADAILKAAE